MKTWVIAWAIVSLVLWGCSSSPTSSKAAVDARWGEYRTFAFATQPSGASSSVESTLRAEVAKQLNARGLTQSSNPDILIQMSVDTEQRVRTPKVRSTGGAAARYPFMEEYLRTLPASYSTSIDQYTEGRLTIDAIDVRQRRQVWRGQTRQRLTQQMLANPQATAARAVDEIFRNVPRTVSSN